MKQYNLGRLGICQDSNDSNPGYEAYTGSLTELARGYWKNFYAIIVARSDVRNAHKKVDGQQGEHYARFGPSNKILKDYKEVLAAVSPVNETGKKIISEAQDKYTKDYIDFVVNGKSTGSKVSRLEELKAIIDDVRKNKHMEVVLICHEDERKGVFCHRHILKYLLSDPEETTRWVAKKEGVSHMTIYRRQKALGRTLSKSHAASVRYGRYPIEDWIIVDMLEERAKGTSYREIARLYELSVSTVHKYINRGD